MNIGWIFLLVALLILVYLAFIPGRKKNNDEK